MQQKLAKTLVGNQSGLKFVKCPRWTHQRLVLLDVHDRSIKSTDLQGNVRTEFDLPYLPGALEVLPDGELLVADAWHRALYRLVKTSQEQSADLNRVPGLCLSDAIVTAEGGIYVGDVGYDFLDPLVDPVAKGMIMLVDERGRASLVAEDLLFPNGMAFTADAATLIVAETLGHRLTAFDVAADGSLENRRVWAQLPDDVNPDGICIDSEGAIWAAATTPRALRILEGGRIVDEIVTERGVFAVTLGGREYTNLFLCTSASSDPVITRRTPSATIEVAAVDVSGAANFPDQQSVLRSIRQ